MIVYLKEIDTIDISYIKNLIKINISSLGTLFNKLSDHFNPVLKIKEIFSDNLAGSFFGFGVHINSDIPIGKMAFVKKV